MKKIIGSFILIVTTIIVVVMFKKKDVDLYEEFPLYI